HLVVKKVKELKNGKYKYQLTGVLNNKVIDAPWFDTPQAFAEGTRVHILFEPQCNTYMGQKSLQAIVKYMRSRKDQLNVHLGNGLFCAKPVLTVGGCVAKTKYKKSKVVKKTKALPKRRKLKTTLKSRITDLLYRRILEVATKQ